MKDAHVHKHRSDDAPPLATQTARRRRCSLPIASVGQPWGRVPHLRHMARNTAQLMPTRKYVAGAVAQKAAWPPATGCGVGM